MRGARLPGRARAADTSRRAVDDAQPLVDIAQADAARHRGLQPLVGDPEAVVFDIEMSTLSRRRLRR